MNEKWVQSPIGPDALRLLTGLFVLLKPDL